MFKKVHSLIYLNKKTFIIFFLFSEYKNFFTKIFKSFFKFFVIKKKFFFLWNFLVIKKNDLNLFLLLSHKLGLKNLLILRYGRKLVKIDILLKNFFKFKFSEQKFLVLLVNKIFFFKINFFFKIFYYYFCLNCVFIFNKLLKINIAIT